MYNKIKKQNGERFAKAIRNYDNGIFDVPNLDKIVKHAGRDAEPIMNYLTSLKEIKIEEHGVYKDPIDLLKQAGYDAFYADTLEKQNSIAKYFTIKEELCTFRSERYKNYHVINCVKENAQSIRRSDKPKREDEYGTSVISIQILKTGGFISIKNRYNHSVENCDNTFGSNPDNIIKGLSHALKHKFNVDFSSYKYQLPDNYLEINGQLIKFHKEFYGIYYGDGFYTRDGYISEIDKNKEIVIEDIVLNLQTKEIKNPSIMEHGLIKALKEEIEGKKLQITKNDKGNKCLVADGIQILELKESQIVSINFPNVTQIYDFLETAESLESVSMKNLTSLGVSSLKKVKSLKNIYMPNLKRMGWECFMTSPSIETAHFPLLEEMSYDCFYNSGSAVSISMPNLKEMGDNCFYKAKILNNIHAPKLKNIGRYCFFEAKSVINSDIRQEYMPNYMRYAIRKNKIVKPIKTISQIIRSNLFAYTR